MQWDDFPRIRSMMKTVENGLLDSWPGTVLMDEEVANYTEVECQQLSEDFNRISKERSCPPVWDTFACWPSANGGTLVARSCRVLLREEIDTSTQLEGTGEPFAFRLCTPWGWLQNSTNYNACIAALGDDEAPGPNVIDSSALTVSTIAFWFSVTSLIFLAATAFIFTHFSSLRCSRTRVHLNLVVALIVNNMMLIVITMPVVVNHPSNLLIPNIKNVPVACKVSLCLKLYSSMASINWMFVEGIQLHSRITTSIFQREAPFKLYYFIGWGVPSVFVVIWAVNMEQIMPESTCWEGYRSKQCVWLLTAPKLAVLLINFVFLLNIIRILVTKVKSITAENKQFRKAIKATVLLFPLLGMTHLLYGITPQEYGETFSQIYMIVNAVLQSSQGIFVSVIHCFMNSEVQTSLRNAYLRALIRRNPNRRSLASQNVTQTSTVFLTHSYSARTRRNNAASVHLGPQVKHASINRAASCQGGGVRTMGQARSPNRALAQGNHTCGCGLNGTLYGRHSMIRTTKDARSTAVSHDVLNREIEVKL